MTLQGAGFALAGAIGGLFGAAGAVALAGACGLAVVAVLGFSRGPAGTSARAPNLSG
jgi:hypothetical protein